MIKTAAERFFTLTDTFPLQDWADLIEYVLRKCTRIRIKHPDKEKSKNPHKPMVEAPGIDLS